MSTGFLSDPKVERIIDRHGIEAVAVTVAMMAQAMRQEKRGQFDLTYRTLGNESHTNRDTAVEVVKTADEVGLLTLEDGDDYEFTASFPAWEKHQNNWRQQKSRAAKQTGSGVNVTDGHADVTHTSPTDRQTNKQTKDAPSAKKSADPKNKPNPDQLPDGFPPHLAAAVKASLLPLQRTAEAKGAKPVTVLAVARAVETRPDRDHVKVASEVEHWCCYGKGEHKPAKDIVARFRTFLDNSDAVATRRPQAPQVMPS